MEGVCRTATVLKKMMSLLLLVYLVSINFADYRSVAQVLPDLPPQEVEALDVISAKLQIKNWTISPNFCSGGFHNGGSNDSVLTNITCNNNATHVTNIQLKRHNLTGNLPAELADLTFLKEIDLSRNYISGTIPTSFAKLPLTILSLLGNRINGSIPKEIGDIATLEELVLENNELGGPLPQNLGNLSRLRRLVLSANNFMGTIPEEFSKLMNLTDFRIDGSTLYGTIPDLIGNWMKITRLDMQGTSMSGPIPSTISQLISLEELRISDLNGPDMTFPDLQRMTKLRTLVLRNCLITGPIPVYIGGLLDLKLLDLSFNKLSGEIPGSLQNSDLDFIMLLTSNSLTGALPVWITNSNKNNKLDVSYNNFTESSSVGCHSSSVNFVSSRSFTESNSVDWCVKKDLPCSTSPKNHELFINCGGGRQITAKGEEYEDDSTAGGPSYFFASSEKWAYSSSGVHFIDRTKASYLASNSLSLNVTGAEFYKTARLAPNSLKYYGLCLRKGSYKVRLHFAEIMFSDDQTFSSLGRRIFDVAIQGKEVLKDFNIKEEANGVGRSIIKEFSDVLVGSTLEIHLYWKGKGTTAIPDGGVYGPLISAISITPNFASTGLPRLSVGATVGIVAASFILLGLIKVVLWIKSLGGKDLEDKVFAAGKDLLSFDLGTSVGARNNTLTEASKSPNTRKKEIDLPRFSFASVSAATDNFSDANKLGDGGFGPVHKGKLQRGYNVAVKRLSRKSGQGLEELQNEAMLIAKLQHKNLVIVLGCCIERDEQILIYEYMPNKSLDFFLFDPFKHGILNWELRLKIVDGIAQGLLYLHQYSRLQIIHRDLKASNILLDKDMNPKISDFGMARIFEGNGSRATKRIVGTYGYMSPEYALEGIFSIKSDVFSFGVLLLEILSGKRNTGFYHTDSLNLLGYTWDLWKSGRGQDVKDPTLDDISSTNKLLRYVNIGLLCVQEIAADRPTMSDVVSMLSNELALVPSPKQPAFSTYKSVLDSHKRPECCSENDATISILEAR